MSNELERELLRLKLAKLERLERQQALERALPHKYLHKLYVWQREYIDDWGPKYQAVCSGNQVGKSSTQIKKLIGCAVSPETWPERWPTLPEGMKPAQWWYLYPTREIGQVEFEEKWRPLLPKYPEDHPQYGWKYWKGDHKVGARLTFNTGINIYFKAYAQGSTNLQAGSVYLIGADEEVPADVLPELQMRVSATRGYMFFVFTATLGQDFWRRVVEERSEWEHARVWQVGLPDCMVYEDGTPSEWTEERIRAQINNCISEDEVNRRVYGKFVTDSGRRVPTFNADKHVVPYRQLDDNYQFYGGVDYGAGTAAGHPSAITIVAIHQSNRFGYVVRHWRGDGIQTTAGDVIDKYLECCRTVPHVSMGRYDFSARDLGTIAERKGLALEKANKSQEEGANVLSTLLKKDALFVMTPTEESEAAGLGEFMQQSKLISELAQLKIGQNKRVHTPVDDSYDSLRYAVVTMPWDFGALGPPEDKKPEEKKRKDNDPRRLEYEAQEAEERERADHFEEIDEWAALFDSA